MSGEMFPNTDESKYIYDCSVTEIVDGDTLDVVIDLGFEIRHTARIRLKGIDTAEIYGVPKESDEYQTGMKHKSVVDSFVERGQSNSLDSPFQLYSHEYERGKYGRVIGDIYSTNTDLWLGEKLRHEFGEEIDYR